MYIGKICQREAKRKRELTKIQGKTSDSIAQSDQLVDADKFGNSGRDLDVFQYDYATQYLFKRTIVYEKNPYK